MKNFKLSINIQLSWSKIMAVVLLACGTVVSLSLKSATVMEITVIGVLLALGVKQVSDIWKIGNRNEVNEPTKPTAGEENIQL